MIVKESGNVYKLHDLSYSHTQLAIASATSVLLIRDAAAAAAAAVADSRYDVSGQYMT